MARRLIASRSWPTVQPGAFGSNAPTIACACSTGSGSVIDANAAALDWSSRPARIAASTAGNRRDRSHASSHTYRAADVDMVITDWNMPEMNGIEFIRALRGLDKMTETPILMVTTNAAKDDIVEALRAGVNNYIVKPFTPDTFKEKIEAVTAR